MDLVSVGEWGSCGVSYLGEGTVVPEVALVGEAVADVSKLALLGVLLNGVEEFLLRDLLARKIHIISIWDFR